MLLDSNGNMFPDRKNINKPLILKGGNYRDWNGENYISSNCYAVDLVMRSVDFYRNRALQGGKPLKRIILSNANYDKFDDHMRLNHMKGKKEYEELCDESNENRKYQVDGVPIDRAGLLNVKQIEFEFYPTMAEALAQPREVQAFEEPKDNKLEGTNVDTKIIGENARPEQRG